jgi:hypothetical protein
MQLKKNRYWLLAWLLIIMVVNNKSISLMRLPGIEPGTSAWKADILPLNYKRLKCCLLALCHFRWQPNGWLNHLTVILVIFFMVVME